MATGTASQDPASSVTAPEGKPARSARQPKPKPVPATLIFFVRHGTTPTTGQVLPGRAPGLHLADSGRAEAEAVAERLASLSGLTALTVPAASTEPTTGGSTSDGANSNGAGRNGAGRTTTARTTAARTTAAGTTAARTNTATSTTTAPTDTTPSRRPGTLTIAAVYASPLERARETAAPIGRRLGLKVMVERGLIEMDFGEWTGAELKALRKLPEWNTIQRYPSGFQFPAGEAFSAMRARMAATVARLCVRHPGQTIVAVSHADTIKAAVSDALGTHLDLFQRIVISPCSVTAISYSPTGPVVLAVNSTGGVGGFVPARSS
jgi:probable phosphomutase (TIGR03848 family)